jgi:hypothetical protein
VNFRAIKGRAKHFSHEKLKTWIDLHGARRSGIVVVEKQNDSTRQGLSLYHGILQLIKHEKITEQFTINGRNR